MKNNSFNIVKSTLIMVLSALLLCSCSASNAGNSQALSQETKDQAEQKENASKDQASVTGASQNEDPNSNKENASKDQASVTDVSQNEDPNSNFVTLDFTDDPALLHPMVKDYHEGGQDDKNVIIFTQDYPEIILPEDEQKKYPNLQTAILEDLNNYSFIKAEEDRELFTEYFNEDMYNSEYFSPMFIETEANILRADENIFSVELIKNDYLGGAHPNHSSEVFTYSTKEGKLITPADVFISKDALFSVLREKLLEYEKNGEVQYFDLDGYLAEYSFDTSYMYGKIAFNMAVRNDGIMFIFNPYELAPYACGTITVLLPYDEYASIMKPGISKVSKSFVSKGVLYADNGLMTGDGFVYAEPGYSAEYGMIDKIKIYAYGKTFEFETYSYTCEPYIVNNDGSIYIYVLESADDDEKFMQVFSLKNGEVSLSGNVNGHFFSENKAEEINEVMELSCYARSDLRSIFCDPDKMTLSDGKVYSMSVDGMPQK